MYYSCYPGIRPPDIKIPGNSVHFGGQPECFGCSLCISGGVGPERNKQYVERIQFTVRQCNGKLTVPSHEQGASHAADGYARATGKVGVCLATSGPGATNLVTGIATAYMDSVPVVAITCNVTNSLLGKDSFQEIDITGVTMPITKYNFIVKDVSRLATVIRRAFTIIVVMF